MKYSVYLRRLQEDKNHRIIVKRLASDLGIDFSQAEISVHRLPLLLLHGATEEESDRLVFDYERLGCDVEKRADKESVTEKPKAEPPLPTAASPAPVKTESATPPTLPPRPSRSSSRIPPARFPLHRRPLAGLVTLAAIGIALTLFLFANKKSLSVPRMDRSIVDKVLQADRETIPDRKIALLKKALSEQPQMKALKRRLSTVYSGKAASTSEQERRIRFYQLAISFNPHNRMAWDGLEVSLEEADRMPEADSVRQAKQETLGDDKRNLGKLFSELPGLEGMPSIANDTLRLSYRSESKDSLVQAYEALLLAEEIRDYRDFQTIEIKMTTPNGVIFRRF